MVVPIAAWNAEHAYFGRLLDLLERQLDVLHTGERPNYELMFDIIFYLRDFSDRQHHPREDAAFARLAQRRPGMELAAPAMPSGSVLSLLEQLAQGRRRVRGGDALFVCGDAFRALYVVHGGFFKTKALDAGGREQVTGFFMAGELLGLDGIGSGRYHLTATALEDSIVCVTPYSLIEQRSCETPALQREIHVALSREIARQQRLMLLLGGGAKA